MAYRTAWMIGSYPALPAQSVTFDGSAQSVATDDYYLYSSTAGLSLLTQVVAAMTTAGVAAPTCYIAKNRKVRLTSSGLFTVTWTSTLLRNLLGFSGNLAGNTSYTATSVSPLLWSPARQESSMLTPLGIRGHVEHLSRQSVSPYTGRTETISHGSREFQRFWFPHVTTERVRTSTDAGGTWANWFENVAVRGARWYLYRNVSEDLSSSVAAGLSGQALGPYIYSAKGKGVSWVFARAKGLERSEVAADIDVPCHVCPEYDS